MKISIRIIVCFIILFPAILKAQENKDKKFGITFGGFVKTDFWVDTRQVAGAREDLFALYPQNSLLDKNGEDINDKLIYNFSAITSRLTGKISGPDAFGAKTSGIIEADFSGQSNPDINGLRLRIAMIKLNWKKSELLFGQFWHPMFTTECFPTVISLNTGAPFNPFLRSPQIRYSNSFGKIKLTATVLSQRDYANSGPFGSSSIYMRNAVIPNGNLRLQYKNKKHLAGLAADYKIIQPLTETDSMYKTDEKIGTYAFMAYYKYSNPIFTFKAKYIYGQNMTDFLLLGGYAVSSRDSLTAKETYTPINHHTFWANVIYGKKIKFGLFGGYTKCLGTSDKNIGVYYSRGSNIDYVYRLAPSISFISNKTQISTEVEYTVAAYGTPDYEGIVKNSNEIGNIRILLTVFYFF